MKHCLELYRRQLNVIPPEGIVFMGTSYSKANDYFSPFFYWVVYIVPWDVVAKVDVWWRCADEKEMLHDDGNVSLKSSLLYT